MTEVYRGGLSALAPLPRLLTAVAMHRAATDALRLLPPLALAGSLGAWALARWRPDAPRSLALGLALLALAPLLRVPRRVRRSPLALAREVDARLDAGDAITTAAELCLRGRDTAGDTAARVIRDARSRLAGARVRAVIPSVTRAQLAAAAAATAVLVAGVAAPVPAARRAPARVVAAMRSAPLAAAAREAAVSLERAAAQDPANARALRELAAEASSMARDLAAGAPRDELLARADAMEQRAEDVLAATRGEAQRRAVDAALQELAAEPALRDALAQGDLASLDDVARRHADRAEARDRARAADALTRAAEAARRAGSESLAASLDDSASLLRRRGEATSLARALAAAMRESPAGRRVAEHLDRGGDDAVARALDEALRAFDEGLSEADRRRVAEALARLASEAGGESRAAFEQASRALTPEEARAAMRALLESLQRNGIEGTRAGRGARAGADARERVARLRAAMQTGALPGGGSPGESGPGGPGAPPSSRETRAVAGGGFVAPTRAATDPAGPTITVATERVDVTGARAGAPTEAAVRAAAPSALHGVERVAMPPAWRAQVRTYFTR